jgi:hypothetical protein
MILGICATVRGQSAVAEAAREEVYRVHVLVVVGSAPETVAATGDLFRAQLARGLDANFGGAWQTTIEAAPRKVITPILGHAEPLSEEILKQLVPDFAQLNKLFVIGVDWSGTEYEVQAREFDTRVQRWTISNVTEVAQSKDILPQAVGAIVRAFSPVGTIGRPRQDMVEVKMHAGAYLDSYASPLVPQPGTLLKVVIRRRRRGSEGEGYSFSTVPWTVLRVMPPARSPADIEGAIADSSTEQGAADEPAGDNKSDATVENTTQPPTIGAPHAAGELPDDVVVAGIGAAICEIHSGLRSPFRVRGISRTDRLAIVVKPRFEQTTLRIHVRLNPDSMLAGYQVFAKEPGAATSTYIGQSDWQGSVVLPGDDMAPLKIYYIKHGSLLLARLPIVAGYERELLVGVNDDSERLRAEGALKGVQDRLIDSLARREIHAARISSRLEAQNLTEEHVAQSKQLLERMRKLPGRNDFIREIQTRQRDFQSGDKTTQSRIDRLFRDTRDVIIRNLTPDLEERLTLEIRDAENRLGQLRSYEAEKQQSGQE